MIRKSWCNVGVSFLIAAAAVLVVASPEAHAQTKPFKITGGGAGPDGLPLPGQGGRPHWAVGQATELGEYYGYGAVQTFSAVPDPSKGIITGTFGGSGPFTFVAANGDALVCDYGQTSATTGPEGTVVLTILGQLPTGSLLVRANFIALFTPVPELCTGRFAGVTGGWVMYAQTLPFVLGSTEPVVYTWEGEGSLVFPKK